MERQQIGGASDPTTAESVVVTPDTDAEAAYKQNACMYKKFYLTTRGDSRTFFLRIPRRLRYLKESEAIKFTITNLEGATDSIEYFIQGQMCGRHP